MLINGKRLFLVNTIAVLAYLSIIVQWLLAVLPFVPGLIRSDLFKTYLSNHDSPAQQSPSAEAVIPEIFSVLFIIIAIFLAVGVLVAGIIAISRIPAVVGKSGAKLTHSATEAVLPVITHHKKITAKNRRLLTARIVFDIKLALVVIPLLLALISPVDALQTMPRDVFIFIAAILAAWSLILFCLQIVVARILRVDLSRIW